MYGLQQDHSTSGGLAVAGEGSDKDDKHGNYIYIFNLDPYLVQILNLGVIDEHFINKIQEIL